MPDNKDTDGATQGSKAFLAAVAGTIILGLIAFGLSLLLKTPLALQIKLSVNDALIGVIATLPPALFLWWFSVTDNPTLAEFRRSQIEFFAQIGFEFTPFRIAVMAIGAGICEELLFRGALQTWLAGMAPVSLAIFLSSVVFGLLHMRTALYAIIAAGVSIYLGSLFALTGNLIAPMITHGLYDALALEYTRRAVNSLQSG